jgi:hypothetical protein
MKSLLLRLLLNPQERALIQGLRKPAPARVIAPLTPDECKRWAEVLRSPLGTRIDVTMINWIHDRAQHAIAQPSAETLAWAKFAYGCRAGWEMAKTLSTTAAAQDGNTGTEGTTEADPTAQHNP